MQDLCNTCPHSMEHKNNLNKLTVGGLLVTLGIIYGDIGTSPLYVMKAIIGQAPINETLVYGGISCIFWTLTLQTTIKYVILTLRADNNGEGGIFSLYALVRRKIKWLTIPAMIGGASLLADGIITPPISVASAVEGLEMRYPGIPTIPIVITIITIIFAFQRFGTKIVGRSFGPIMMVWFSMLGILGVSQIVKDPSVLKALSPVYAYNLLFEYPGGIWLLGAVFLCTTGAEALYSDLGHCGRQNIRISWIYVKTMLLLNYFGQGAWLMQHNGEYLTENPFYLVMPQWFLMYGIVIATMAAIIASQALISGSFTLISEAIRLNFWPKLKLVYPTMMKGQLYVPAINTLLWLGCVGITLYFRRSEHMEAAYGLSITITMLMTTLLLGHYLLLKKISPVIIASLVIMYFTIEGAFLIANLQKFMHGGYVTLFIGMFLLFIMVVWNKANMIKNRLTEYVKIDKFMDPIIQLSQDMTIPKYATNLVYLTSSTKSDEIESKIVYSLFQRQPKRADIYWFVHVDTTDEPYTMEYKVQVLATNDVVKVTFRLGFRVEQRVNLYFRKVVEEMVKNKEVDITSRYPSLSKQNITGDFRFIVMEKYLSNENQLPILDQLILDIYFFMKKYTISEVKWFGLESSTVHMERVPLIIKPVGDIHLQRIYNNVHHH